MFALRNIQRVFLRRTSLHVRAITPARTFGARVTRFGPPTLAKNSLTFRATFSTSNVNRQTQEQGTPEEEFPWINYLEAAANAPFLSSLPPNDEDKLRRAFTLLFHILLYLGRPQGGAGADYESVTQQFLLAFSSAPVSPTSEITQARHAVGFLTKVITSDVNAVAPDSPLRQEHTQIFELVDKLQTLSEEHLNEFKQGEIPTLLTEDAVKAASQWQKFWSQAQPNVLALGEALDRGGYGIGEELEKEAMEEERKNQ